MDLEETEEMAAGVDVDCAEGAAHIKGQKVLTAGWLTMKEVALVLGQVVRSVPLSGASHRCVNFGCQWKPGTLTPNSKTLNAEP